MNNLFLLIFLASFVCLIIGLVKPTAFSRFIKGEITRKKIGLIFGIATLVFFILFGMTTNTEKATQSNDNKQTTQTPPTTTNTEVTQKETQKSPTLVGCTVSNPTISYSLLAESTRQSDVKNIPIKECYILLEKKAPTITELTQLATVLGKNNENIEFRIFDDSKAYKLYEKYVAPHRENDASDADWKFLYDHFLASYLKANTYLSNNYLQPVGNAYYMAGQTSIPEIPIVN